MGKRTNLLSSKEGIFSINDIKNSIILVGVGLIISIGVYMWLNVYIEKHNGLQNQWKKEELMYRRELKEEKEKELIPWSTWRVYGKELQVFINGIETYGNVHEIRIDVDTINIKGEVENGKDINEIVKLLSSFESGDVKMSNVEKLKGGDWSFHIEVGVGSESIE